MKAAETLIERVTQWATRDEKIIALALVGSWARGTPRQDSDIDLVILVDEPHLYLADEQWISNFGEVKDITDEDWGAVQSKRVFYKSGHEIEFSIARKNWADTMPVNPGTEKVVRGGLKILYDTSETLKALVEAIYN